MVSCGPVHQSIQPTADDIRNLKRIAVVIPNDGEFIVLLDRATATPAPAVLFGLVGAAIASAHNASRDTEKMTALNPHLTDFSARATFAETFGQTLNVSGRQNNVCQVAHAQALAFEDCRRQIRPALALRLVFEIKDDLATLAIVKRGKKIFRGCDDSPGRRAGRGVRLGKAVRPSAEKHD
jgi:hypothetical protein